MLLGISTASYFTKAYAEEAFARIAECGARVAEVFFSTFSEYKGELADRIVAARCVDVHSVHSLTNQFEPELFSRNERANADADMILDNLLSIAERLGAKSYTFHGPSALKKVVYNHDYARLAEVTNRLIDKCAQRGVRLSYENVHWAYFSTPEFFGELKKRCPNLCATLDIKQAMQAGYDYTDFLPVMADRLNTVHICDYDEERNLYLPGRGRVDFTDMFKRLYDIGFNGAVMIEVYPQSYNDFSELKDSFEYITECADKAGVLFK